MWSEVMHFLKNSECLRRSNDVSIPGLVGGWLGAACPAFQLLWPPKYFCAQVRCLVVVRPAFA